MKILLAEDEPTTLARLERQLMKWKYEVVLARDGREAWQALHLPDAPRLALLDWMMPEMDGLEICRAVRQEKREPYIYIIMLSSLQKEEEIVEGLEAGADDYITKPFKTNELRVRLRAGQRIVELQSSLSSHAADLEAANRELEAFNYTAAHDLRQPLNLIGGYCQAINMHCADRLCDTCGSYVKGIYSRCRRMSDLLQALLKFSSMSRGEPDRKTIDLSEMAHSVIEELRAAEPERQVEARIPDGITAWGDGNLLLVVLQNLIGNAWKYTGHRENACIELGSEDHNGETVYFVRDNGAGFCMADAEKLFLPFQRLPGAEEFRGHGIGLATVQKIIMRHGGRIWASSEPGKGSTFFFVLP